MRSAVGQCNLKTAKTFALKLTFYRTVVVNEMQLLDINY